LAVFVFILVLTIFSVWLQAPFILGGTVRDNILFGRPYEEERYRLAVQAAQLEADLAMLPAGDMTELGKPSKPLGKFFLACMY